MAEAQPNLWAPWRAEYIGGLADAGGCFLCEYRDRPAKDRQNHVVWRSPNTLVVLNRYPYTGGHLLIAPVAHVAELQRLSRPVLAELMLRVRDAQRVLAAALRAQGFNIGMNLGRCAGAGLPDHLHLHVVPRWNGDTNFMTAIGDVRVIPTALDKLRALFLRHARRLGLPADAR